MLRKFHPGRPYPASGHMQSRREMISSECLSPLSVSRAKLSLTSHGFSGKTGLRIPLLSSSLCLFGPWEWRVGGQIGQRASTWAEPVWFSSSHTLWPVWAWHMLSSGCGLSPPVPAALIPQVLCRARDSPLRTGTVISSFIQRSSVHQHCQQKGPQTEVIHL